MCVPRPEMELGLSRQNFEAKHNRTPGINITHHSEVNEEAEELSKSLPAYNSTQLPYVHSSCNQRKQTQVISSTEPSCARDCTSHTFKGMSRNSQCVSFMLPLEVELNVLGVVEQGVIDRGQHAKLKRNGSIRKRNYSVPSVLCLITPTLQKQRPRSHSYDLRQERANRMLELLQEDSLPSTTFCSTQL